MAQERLTVMGYFYSFKPESGCIFEVKMGSFSKSKNNLGPIPTLESFWLQLS